jgi:putative transcriptional regulator
MLRFVPGGLAFVLLMIVMRGLLESAIADRTELDVMLARRKMSVGDFAMAVGITPANVAVLKNGRARAIRFSTLDSICRVLDCQPGDILRWTADPPA